MEYIKVHLKENIIEGGSKLLVKGRPPISAAMKKEIEKRGKIMDKLLNKVEKPLSNLYSRWLDEKEYEDIRDYGKVIKKLVGKGFRKMTKKPFGFTYDLDKIIAQVFINKNSIGWKRIK